MLRPGKSSNGSPSHSGGSYSSGGYYNNGYNAGYSSQNQQSYPGYSGGYHQQPYQPQYSQPQQQPPHSPRRNQPESPFMKVIKSKWIWTCLLCFVLLGTTLHYRNLQEMTLAKLHVKSLEDAEQLLKNFNQEKSKWRKDTHVHLHAQEEYKKKIDSLVKENERLSKKHDQAQRYLQESKDTIKQRDSAMQHQISLLQNATSRESRRAVLEKYGPGPHRVMMILRYKQGNKFQLDNVLVEMAPLDLVPHAIHLFLEQVSHKLWDGTYLYLNGPHVYQSGPQDYQDKNKKKNANKLQKFIDQGLDKLAFPEYSPDFPHLPFTLGFTGRPGGPDFYINKGDNTVPHGPGGQSQHGLKEQADPCFAIVVEGQDALEKLKKLPTRPKSHEFGYFFESPIEIMSARIVNDKDEKRANKNAKQQEPREATPKQAQAPPKNAQPKVAKKTDQVKVETGNMGTQNA